MAYTDAKRRKVNEWAVYTFFVLSLFFHLPLGVSSVVAFLVLSFLLFETRFQFSLADGLLFGAMFGYFGLYAFFVLALTAFIGVVWAKFIETKRKKAVVYIPVFTFSLPAFFAGCILKLIFG